MFDLSPYPPELLREAIGVLRYLDQEHKRGFAIDAINMESVARTLAKLDGAEAEHARQKAARRAEAEAEMRGFARGLYAECSALTKQAAE